MSATIGNICRCCLKCNDQVMDRAIDDEMEQYLMRNENPVILHITKVKYLFKDIDLLERGSFMLCFNCLKYVVIAYKFVKSLRDSKEMYVSYLLHETIKHVVTLCRCCLLVPVTNAYVHARGANNMLYHLQLTMEFCGKDSQSDEEFSRIFVICDTCLRKLAILSKLKRVIVKSNVTYTGYVRKLDNGDQNVVFADLQVRLSTDIFREYQRSRARVQEVVEKVKEEPVVKVKEEPIDKIKEEPVDKIKKEPVDKIKEGPVDKIKEEPVDKIKEEPVDKINEEPVVKIKEEPIEEVARQVAGEIMNEIMGEIVEEVMFTAGAGEAENESGESLEKNQVQGSGRQVNNVECAKILQMPIQL